MIDSGVDLNFDIEGFVQRAREAMFPEKITPFAARAGLPQATVSKIMGGGSVAGPRIDVVAKMADALGVSLDWLVYGRGDGHEDGGICRIPRYAVQLAAGAGSWNEGRRHLEDIPVTRSFMAQIGRTTSANLSILEARGDSMEPTIANRALMVVDEGAKDLFDAVFAFVLAGEARVKRFRRTITGLLLISDNADYPPETVPNEELDQLLVVGQVLGVWQAI